MVMPFQTRTMNIQGTAVVDITIGVKINSVLYILIPIGRQEWNMARR
jgi:hypothetical protein